MKQQPSESPNQNQQQSQEGCTSHPAYVTFLASIKTKATKQAYSIFLKKYYLNRPENKNLTLDQILSKPIKTLEYEIISIITHMQNEQHLSYASINLFLAAVQHFLEINDIVINKRKMNRFKGSNIAKYEYRSYTHEEIGKLLSGCDERMKAAVLLMASTGMRIGALPELKLKHLKKWTVPHLSHYHIYQITVYANSPKDKYYTFCTPEAAKSVDEYLAIRKRYGFDVDNPEIHLFIQDFDKTESATTIQNHTKKSMRLTNPESLSKILVHYLEKTGLRKRLKVDSSLYSSTSEMSSFISTHRNELHPCHSLRIFCVTNLQRAKIDKTIREMLVGHSIGIDKSYYKPQEEEILEEYLKAVDNLLLTTNIDCKSNLIITNTDKTRLMI
jgi:integrase